MTTVAPLLGADHETPAYFPSGDEWLFGILTHPPASARGTAVILLQGGDHIPAINRNRVWVRLARTLPRAGYHVLRLDYHGVGESTGTIDAFELEKPFTADVEAAVRWLRAEGIQQFVLVGICFGAGTALACVGRIEGLRGVLACSHPIYELEMLQTLGTAGYLRRIWGSEGPVGVLRAARRWRSYLGFLARRVRAPRRSRGGGRPSRSFLGQMEEVAARRIPTLFLYGTEDGLLERFERAREGRLGATLERPGSTIELEMIDGRVHDLTTLAVQHAFVQRVEAWLARLERG
jgi:dienelactone hydrolase